jgi:hypothetical protein
MGPSNIQNPLVAICLQAAMALTASAGETLHVYHIGNSVTDTIKYDRLAKVAEGMGDAYKYGRHTIPGAPLSWTYENPDGGFGEEPYGRFEKALPGFVWDAITLQPFDRQLSGSDGDRAMGAAFIQEALKQPENAKARILVYSRWPRRDSEEATTFYGRTYQEQWERSYTEPSYDGGFETRDYFEQVLEAWREDFPAMTVEMVPVGDVLYAMADQIDSAQLPPFKSITEIYTDAIHFDDGGEHGNVGSYAVALTFYATLFKKSPVGDKEFGLWGIKDPALAAKIQKIVWKVVAGHPYSGVPPDPG